MEPQDDLLTTATPPRDTVPERDFAATLGVERDLIKKTRNKALTPEEDWIIGPPNASIRLTLSGQKKIRAALGLPDTAPENSEKKEGPVTLVVFRFTRNPHIIEMWTADKKKVRLRVKSTENFIPRMEVPNCVHIQADFYEYRGKLPRRRGRIPQ